MAVMRGVEYGLSVARSAKQGTLTMSNERGRILAEGQSGSTRVVSVEGDVRAARVDTLYGRLGDLLGWASVALTAILIGITFRPKGAPRAPATAFDPGRDPD
jgi:apolipoprotein N-acyltransferase